MSTAYHPQSDGQTERLNQCLETFLRCFVHVAPTCWSQWLVVAEYWYNTTYHSALGCTPFEVLYGYTPRHFGISSDNAISVTDLADWVHERELMQRVIQQHLLRAQQHMKRQADKHRSEREFAVAITSISSSNLTSNHRLLPVLTTSCVSSSLAPTRF